MIDATTSPPPELGCPKNAPGGTLMALATSPCEPEVALRCWIPITSSKGDTRPPGPQPQISCPCSADIAVKPVFWGAETTMIIACTEPLKSLIEVGWSVEARLGQLVQKTSATPMSAACVP